jgi:hypothetical protein
LMHLLSCWIKWTASGPGQTVAEERPHATPPAIAETGHPVNA